MLEKQLKVVPENDKYTIILNELYSNLEQDDYYINNCNTKVMDKTLTYSRFRMWEEVNQELNEALARLYDTVNIDIDLKYANEYDQKLWEELHPESILQIGDLDRQKFFQNPNTTRNYGAFRAEFQKWIMIGRNQNTYQVFESNREKLCQEWTALPKFVDQVHYHKLTKFQENVELNETMALLHNCRIQPREKILKDFCTASSIQRDRVPISCESNRVWKDILENRYLPLNMLNTTIESKKKAANDQQQDRDAKNRFAFKRLLNYIWDKLLIARQSRKQNLLEVCKRYLTEVEQQIVKSDKDQLKGVSMHKEKYLYIQERMKLILEYFKHNIKLDLKPDEFKSVKYQLISKGLEISDEDVLKGMRRIEDEALNSQDNSDASRGKS